MTLVELNTQFSTDEQCRELLVRLRWPDGVECPKCKRKRNLRSYTQKTFQCLKCRYNFSVTTGTIFHHSHIPLEKWCLTVLLMCESKKGISANQVKQMLGVCYKTAWYLCHRVRKAAEEAKNRPQLDGTVEVDETFVGGKYDRRRKRELWDTSAVIGRRRRNGNFEARKIPTRSRQDSLSKTRAHDSVNHSAEERVRGEGYTNRIESARSLFRQFIVGAFHQVSAKHWEAYWDEFECRSNNRENPNLFRDTLTRLLGASPFQYTSLTRKSAEPGETPATRRRGVRTVERRR